MRANVNLRNPFLRENPYYVPQHFYSHEKPTYYNNSIDYSPYKAYERRPKDDHLLDNSRQYASKNNNLNGSRFEAKPKESNVLKRKNINAIENPFYRKNLIPLNKDCQPLEQSNIEYQLEARHLRLFQSSKSKDPIIQSNNYLKIPSSKHLTDEPKENKPKYLSTQLKIKLRSQTEILQNPISAQMLSCSPTKNEFVTLGRMQNSIQYRYSAQSCSQAPDELVLRGKTYYLQVQS